MLPPLRWVAAFMVFKEWRKKEGGREAEGEKERKKVEAHLSKLPRQDSLINNTPRATSLLLKASCLSGKKEEKNGGKKSESNQNNSK